MAWSPYCTSTYSLHFSPQAALTIEDDSLYEEGAEIPETGYVDEQGELRRPWCPATRILEHREMVGGVGML